MYRRLLYHHESEEASEYCPSNEEPAVMIMMVDMAVSYAPISLGMLFLA